MREATQAAKMIRQELKEEFPKLKFSVQTQHYSMGNSINIYYRGSDNINPTAIDEIVNKYKAGYFDGMTDTYEFILDHMDLPKAMFIHKHRMTEGEWA